MAGTDTATTEATAPVEATPTAEDTNEEAFDAAFEEFAAEDDTGTVGAPDPGPKNDDPQAGAVAPAKTTEEKPASGEESPDTDDLSAEASAKAGAAPADQPGGDAAKPEDIWGDATPEQKAAFEAAQQENRSHRGRASALARQQAAEKAATEETTEATDEEYEAFKSEYPEVAGPVEKRYEARIAKLEAKLDDQASQITGITDGQTQNAIDTEEALLVQRHPDWEQLTASEDFVAWLPQQPRYVQEGFARNGTAIVDGQEAASLIDLFKGNRAAPETPKEETNASKDTPTDGKATRRQRRLESAVQTESGQAGPGAGPPEGDFDAAFDHFAALP